MKGGDVGGYTTSVILLNASNEPMSGVLTTQFILFGAVPSQTSAGNASLLFTDRPAPDLKPQAAPA